MTRRRDIARLASRIATHLTGWPNPVSVTVLCRRMGAERRDVDRALSLLGTRVEWFRIGRGGDRFYELRRQL